MKKIIFLPVPLLVTALALCQGSATMSFDQTSVTSALRAVGKRMGANIVYYGKDVPKVTLDIVVSTPDQAVQAVASAAGLAYRKVNNTYVVAPPDSMRQALAPYGVENDFIFDPTQLPAAAQKVQDAFPYATVRPSGNKLILITPADDVPEARNLIQELQNDGRTVTEVVAASSMTGGDVARVLSSQFADLKIAPAGDGKGAPVLITGTAPMVGAAKDLIAKLQQGYGEDTFQVYTLKYASAQKVMDFLKDAAKDVEAYIAPPSYSPERAVFSPLGSSIGSAIGTTNSGTNNVNFGNTNAGGVNTLVPTTSDYTLKNRPRAVVLRGAAKRVDAVIRMLEAIDVKPRQVSVEVSVVETSPSLIENVGFQWSWSPIQFFEQAPGSAAGIGTTTRPSGVGTFSRAPFSFASVLNAEIQKGDAKVLAKPTVEVVDDNDASIFVGDTLRARLAQAGALGAQTIDIREFPVGIILLLHPRVNDDGNITMHVNPVVSTVTQLGQDNIPQTSSREAETTVIVKDGQTIVLGGLIRDEYSKVITEVPFLSQLPIIGQLFRNRTTNHRRTDVIVTITPHLMKDTPEGAK